MKNILLTLILLSPLAFAEEETFICDCDSYINSKDYLVRSCPGYPELYGLIINSEENTLSFQDEKYYYKNNPNTLSVRRFEGRKNADDFMDQEITIEIEFEKVTNMLRWKREDLYWVQDADTKLPEVTNRAEVTQYFICESTK